ncbi:non-oxidative hydroxyarylic acid decarboxylases subunit D [Streptomyces sasae]|uniref:non-oxidative hydroxyarylic acid decarboxylases subunit D n=1 Tax=Streptomyces sasae TaxID=1266772 RepID=UPI00292E6841|nr:non-oxidative hydroxyarylic acid decarboxylases subunit D [Streptomyces sasae]
MTAATTPHICPRCSSPNISLVAESPVPGHWVMRSCSRCWYAWRSTEPAAATDPDAYPDDFRITPDDIQHAPRLV